MTQRKAARENQLLKVATRLFREKGYHNTSMQDIADGLGVQKASLYYYIDSKKDLLRQLLRRAASILGIQIDEIYAAALPPVQKLRRALENHAVTMMENLNLVSVYLHEYRNLSPQQLEEILATRKHYERVLGQILADGIASGEFRPVNMKMAIRAGTDAPIGPPLRRARDPSDGRRVRRAGRDSLASAPQGI